MKLRTHRKIVGSTLVEMVLAILIVALLIGFISVNVEGILRGSRMDRDISQFVNALRRTAEQAILTRESYIVLIEVTDGYYQIYREPSKKELKEEIELLFPEQQLLWSYIYELQDGKGEKQYSGDFRLKASPSGWSDSVLFTLTDEFDQWRYVRCDHLTGQVHISRSPLALPEVRENVSMSEPR